MDKMKEIFGNNYWEGKRFLSKANIKDLPAYTMLYRNDTEQLLYKTDSDKWSVIDIDINKNINCQQKCRICSYKCRNTNVGDLYLQN
jgi:hypothetical protein